MGKLIFPLYILSLYINKVQKVSYDLRNVKNTHNLIR